MARSSHLHFDLRWDRSRSWPCFDFDDDFLVGGGALVASYYCGVDICGGAITDNLTVHVGFVSILSQP